MSQLTISDLDTLHKRYTPPPRPLLTKEQATQQVFGAIKLIKYFYGGKMHDDVEAVDYLCSRVDTLEAENAALRQALSAISAVLEIHTSPFEDKAPSKVSRLDVNKWIIAAAESIKWVMQRAENALDPKHIVDIAKDPE